MNQFYVNLPSNASTDVFPGNTLSKFRVQLPHAINLDGDWEVALKEIQLPTLWNNVSEKFDAVKLVHTYRVKTIPKILLVEPVGGSFSESVVAALPAKNSHALTFNIIKNENGTQKIECTVHKDFSISLDQPLMEIFKWPVTEIKGTVISSEDISTADLNTAFKNYRDHDYRFKIYLTIFPPPQFRSHEMKIPHGRYTSLTEVIAAIQDEVRIHIDRLNVSEQFMEDHKKAEYGLRIRLLANQKISIDIESMFFLDFPKKRPGLGLMLGFSDDQVGKYLASNVVSHYPGDVSAGIYGFYVYSPLIKPQIVGDIRAPLLRIVPLEGNLAGVPTYVKNYESPDFYPLLSNSFDSIEILICADDGSPVKFITGKTVVKLFFKRSV